MIERIRRFLCAIERHDLQVIETHGAVETVICRRWHCRRMWLVNTIYHDVHEVKL